MLTAQHICRGVARKLGKIAVSTQHSNFHLCVAQRQESTIDEKEVDKFSRIAKHWWDLQGEFAALHTLNDIRVPLIRDAICGQKQTQNGEHIRTASQPLAGNKIADIGCGGGILCEPLARLGAQVTGVDASPENIAVANLHADNDYSVSRNINYICSGVEDLPETEFNKFDGVVASEIIEHVTNKEMFIASCCQLIKPGGALIMTTLNKTALSYGLGVVMAEDILKIVPSGAHDWDKFVSPEDIQRMLEKNGLYVKRVSGMTMNPLTLKWNWIGSTLINYAIHAVKN